MIEIYDILQKTKAFQILLSFILSPIIFLSLVSFFYRREKKAQHERVLKQEKVRHAYRMEELRIKGQINGRTP